MDFLGGGKGKDKDRDRERLGMTRKRRGFLSSLLIQLEQKETHNITDMLCLQPRPSWF